MAGSSTTYLPALALSRRPGKRLAVDDVSLSPVWRSVLFLAALSLPVLGSAVADRFHSEGIPRTVGALAVSHSPLSKAARKPDTARDALPAGSAAR